VPAVSIGTTATLGAGDPGSWKPSITAASATVSFTRDRPRRYAGPAARETDPNAAVR